MSSVMLLRFFFFNDTATTEIYTLSLHDALPIWTTKNSSPPSRATRSVARSLARRRRATSTRKDRKSTRLNSSHGYISYAVFCLKKKNAPATNELSNGGDGGACGRICPV